MGRQEIDVRGLKCPLPILLTRRALDHMAPGNVLRVMASGAVAEFRAFAKQAKYELQFTTIENGDVELLLWRS